MCLVTARGSPVPVRTAGPRHPVMNTTIPSPRKANGMMPFLFAAVALATTLHGGDRTGLVGEVHSGYLLGGAHGGSWMEADTAKESIAAAASFTEATRWSPSSISMVTAAWKS